MVKLIHVVFWRILAVFLVFLSVSVLYQFVRTRLKGNKMPRKNTNFHWYDFGVVDSLHEDGTYLYVQNTKGDERKISISAYKDSVPILRDKIKKLVGEHCWLRVSKNTANWSEEKWFSDIDIDKNKDNFLEFGDDKEVESNEELKKKLEKTEKERDEEAEGRKKAEAHENTKEKLIKAEKENADMRTNPPVTKGDKKIEERDEGADKQVKREESAKKIKQMIKKVGEKREIIVNGHPQRLLALCTGIEMHGSRKNLEVEIKSLPDKKSGCDVEVVGQNKITHVILGVNDASRIYAATFFHPERENFDRALKKLGYARNSLKDRTDIDFVDLHHKVVAQMDEM